MWPPKREKGGGWKNATGREREKGEREENLENIVKKWEIKDRDGKREERRRREKKRKGKGKARGTSARF